MAALAALAVVVRRRAAMKVVSSAATAMVLAYGIFSGCCSDHRDGR
jgi:hypothetical protein